MICYCASTFPKKPVMERFFNNAGPIQPENHYHIDPLTRLDWADIRHLIADQCYFVLTRRARRARPAHSWP
jgi:hypothetical protein